MSKKILVGEFTLQQVTYSFKPPDENIIVFFDIHHKHVVALPITSAHYMLTTLMSTAAGVERGRSQCLVLRGTRVLPRCIWAHGGRGIFPPLGGMKIPPGGVKIRPPLGGDTAVTLTVFFIIRDCNNHYYWQSLLGG